VTSPINLAVMIPVRSLEIPEGREVVRARDAWNLGTTGETPCNARQASRIHT
jgi:hypothetical protein